MTITPLDVRQQRFQTVMRGYDRGAVQAFLLDVADEYDHALRDTDTLRQHAARLEGVVAEHQGQERNLRNTLLTAQKLADDIKEHAQQEATRVVRDAESRADLVLQAAQGQLEDVQREIDGLRMKRQEVELSVVALISTLHHTLEFIHEQDGLGRDQRDLLLRTGDAELTPTQTADAVPIATTHGCG